MRVGTLGVGENLFLVLPKSQGSRLEQCLSIDQLLLLAVETWPEHAP